MNQVLKIYARVCIFLFPIFYLVGVLNGLNFGKNWFLVASALIGLLIWIADLLISKRNEIKFSWFLGFFAILTIWAGVTFFRLSPGGEMSSLMNPIGMGTMLSLLIWAFLWMQISNKNEFEKQFNFLTVSGIVVGIISLLVFLIPNSKLPLDLPKNNPIISISNGFSITGSIIGEILFLVYLAFEWLKRLLNKLKDKSEPGDYIKEAVAVIFFGLLLFLNIYKVVKSGWPTIDQKTAWVVAVETLKTHPIFGMGIGNFLEAFTAFKPASFNLTKLWSSSFTISSMGILQWWTEMGLVGLVLVLWLVGGIIKKRKNEGFWGILLVLASVFLLPMTITSLFLLVWLLANKLFEHKEAKLILKAGEKQLNILPAALSLVLVVGIGLGAYWWVRILLGEIYLRESLVKAAKNDGIATYNLQIKAIGANQINSDYRKWYSQTNLALAQNILSNENVSDEDKQKASTLIQQSVREAKAAISLNNYYSDYWTNLATIYRSLIGLVDGAGDWSLQAYQQAIALDPVNPLLKMDMGGLLYAANNNDEADRVFEEVVVNKSDYANGWYNWAYTAKKNNKLQDAVNRLSQALKLVPTTSGDYDKASKELDSWKKELEELTKKQQEAIKQTQESDVKKPETLKTAEPLPTPGEEDKVAVPTGDIQPPKQEVEVTPTPILPTE